MIAPEMVEQRQFLEAIFGQEPGYVFISTYQRAAKDWRDRSFVYPLQIDDMLTYIQTADQAGLDVYVAAQLYRDPNRRRKDMVKACPSAWADLDTASPWGVDPEPSVVLETSPGRWHGFWRSARVLSAPEAEELSRRIAYAHHHAGADLGGWDLTQVLRVPGTRNHKYPGAPVVQLARCISTPLTDADFARLPAAPARVDALKSDADGSLAPPVPLRPHELERWQQTDAADRSTWAMGMVAILKEHGLADRLVEVALANHPIYLAKAREKWGNKESLIHDDIRRCLQRWREQPRVDLYAALGGGVASATATPAPEPPPAVWLQPISALLDQEEQPIDWLVTDLFSSGSSGWVAAEPKVGKSWLVLELVHCLTTGERFLGRFAVPRPRTVIYLQEEDSPQRVLRRFNQLLAGTPGRQRPPDARLRYAIRSGFKLDAPQWATRLRAELAQAPAEVVVLDVFQRMHLKDENAQAQMAEVLEVLNQLTREFGTAFIVVHHYRKSPQQPGNSEPRPNQMLRGSSVLAGWGECSLFARKSKHGRNRFFVVPESKDSPELDEFLVVIEDQPNGGVRLRLAEDIQGEKLKEEEQQFLALLREMWANRADVTAQTFAARIGASRSTAYRVLEMLVAEGFADTDEAVFGRTKQPTRLYVPPSVEAKDDD